jgi:hypothetical protein
MGWAASEVDAANSQLVFGFHTFFLAEIVQELRMQ